MLFCFPLHFFLSLSTDTVSNYKLLHSEALIWLFWTFNIKYINVRSVYAIMSISNVWIIYKWLNQYELVGK